MVMRLLLTVSASALLLSSPVPSNAGALDFLHDKVLVNGHTCMKGHSHLGKGGASDQAAAMSKAARDWSDFTSFEYGAEWGHFGLAASKSYRCGLLRDAWLCEVEAVPCRL